MELVRAQWVKSCSDCGAGTVREPRKRNVHRWKPVPEDWCGTADRGLSVFIVNCRQTFFRIGDGATVKCNEEL
jgi:hypothetical protein